MPTFERREQLITSENQDILVVGNGYVGEKAQQLIDKAGVLREIGFKLPPMTVLAQDFFDDYFQENGLGNSLTQVVDDESVIKLIQKGQFNQKQIETLNQLCQRFGDTPIVIRSSAAGDANGTGIYESVVIPNKPESVQTALKTVLASYFTQSAIDFRRNAQTGSGMGVIIQPLIGQEIDGDYFPVISGHGYTSTPAGEGYVMVVPGFGCAVQTRYGEKINKEIIEEFGSVFNYLDEEEAEMIRKAKPVRMSYLLRTDSKHKFEQYSLIGFNSELEEIKRTSLPSYSFDGYQILGEKFNNIFEMMAKMEEKFSKPQYIEWAVTLESGKPIFNILQIADADKKYDLMDFGDFGEVLLEGHSVIGSGVKEISQTVVCRNISDIKKLNEFNKKNSGYLLLYTASLASEDESQSLEYSDFSNASVFLEIPDFYHSDTPLSHFQGQLDMSKKLFGVLCERKNWYINQLIDLAETSSDESTGFNIYHGNFKIIASERQNKIVIVPNTK